MKILDRNLDFDSNVVEISLTGLPEINEIHPEINEIHPEINDRKSLDFSLQEIISEGKIEKIANGIWDIDIETYHSTPGLSRSQLWELTKSPLHFWHKYRNPDYVKPAKTEALIFGDLVHTLVLEPQFFDCRFVISPKFDKRTKIGKHSAMIFESSIAGRTSITQDDKDKADLMAKAVLTNKYASQLLKDCMIEKSIYFTHPESGLQCKVRPDAWRKNIVIDLKTSADASYNAFQRSAMNYGYFLQAAMTSVSLTQNDIHDMTFIFIVVESSEPYGVAIYPVDREAVEKSIFMFNDLMTIYNAYSQLSQNKVWESYPMKTLVLPNWYKELPQVGV